MASRARAAAGSSPPRWRVGSPSSTVSAGVASRTANSRPMPSAYRRRPTKPSTSRDSRSTHCASSTSQISGCSAAASASSVSTPRPTRNRSAGGPAARPNAELSASRCGAGSRPIRSRNGIIMRCNAAKPNRNSDSTPTTLSVRTPSAACAVYCSRRVFPMPGSPTITSDRLSPRRTASTRSSRSWRTPLRPTISPGTVRAAGDPGPVTPPGSAPLFPVPPVMPQPERPRRDDVLTRSASRIATRVFDSNSRPSRQLVVRRENLRTNKFDRRSQTRVPGSVNTNCQGRCLSVDDACGHHARRPPHSRAGCPNGPSERLN